MGRTLYLCESTKNIQITRDGPSIWIKDRDRAGYRVPVALIGRVVVIGNILLDTGAVTLFSESGVPVVFMSRLADEIAFATPVKGELPAHYLLQRSIAGDEAVRATFLVWKRNWQASFQKNVIKRLYSSLAADIRMNLQEGDYAEMLSYLRPWDEAKWSIVMQFVDILLMGVVIEELHSAGIDPHPAIIRKQERYGLARDICDVLQPEIDIQSLQFFDSTIEKPSQDRKFQSSRLTEHAVKDIVHRFENRRLATQRMIAALIEDLILIMRRGRR